MISENKKAKDQTKAISVLMRGLFESVSMANLQRHAENKTLNSLLTPEYQPQIVAF